MFNRVKLVGLLHPDWCISLTLLQVAFRLQLLTEVLVTDVVLAVLSAQGL